MERRGTVPPIPPTTFVGRGRDRAEITEALRRHRLVTLVGPAFVGKSRLAAEISRDLGARWVDLGGVADEPSLISALFRALSVEPIGAPDPIEALVDALDATDDALFVLDGADGVAGPLARLLGVVLSVPGHTRFLCTLRPVLGVPGELRWTLSPLDAVESARLFVDRARLVCPELSPDDPELAPTLARLGGFPLGLEIGAALLPVLGLRGLAEAPLTPLTELVHRSVEALGPGTRAALLACAVFAAPFDRAAACAVLPGDPIDHLRTLVEGSLLHRAGVHEPRFSLYAPVRAWAEQQPVCPATLTRHAAYVLRRAEATLEPDAIADLLPELLAVERRLRSGEVHLADVADDEARLRLLCSATSLLQQRGVDPAVDAWLTAVVPLSTRRSLPASLRARTLSLAASTRQRQGDFAAAAAFHLEAGCVAVEAPGVLAELWLRWLVDRVVTGHCAEARAVAATLLEHLEAGLSSEPWIAPAARMYGALALLLPGADDGEATVTVRRETHVLRALGQRRLAAIGLANLAVHLHYLGRNDEALAITELVAEDDEPLDAHARTSIAANHASILHERAFARDLHGDLEVVAEAHAAYRTAQAGFVRLAARGYAALVRAHHALLWLEAGELEHAELEAVEVLHDHVDRPRVALAYAELASIEALAGRFGDARGLLDQARAHVDDDPAVAVGVELHASHLLLRERLSAGTATRELTQQAVRSARRHAAVGRGPFSPRIRAAARLVARAGADATDGESAPTTVPEGWSGALVIGQDHAWLRSPVGRQADLSARRKLRVLVAALVEARRRAPGVPVTTVALMAAVWPDERFVADAGRTRLHTLVLALRNLGLRDVLRSSGTGYLLDPSVPLVLAEF